MLKELVKQYTPASVIGVLLGIALVLWVEPATGGGAALLVAVTVLICIAVAILISFLRPVANEKSNVEEK